MGLTKVFDATIYKVVSYRPKREVFKSTKEVSLSSEDACIYLIDASGRLILVEIRPELRGEMFDFYMRRTDMTVEKPAREVTNVNIQYGPVGGEILIWED